MLEKTKEKLSQLEKDGIGYIVANSSSIEHLHRNLKQGNTFAVFDAFGDILGEAGRTEGLYYKDTRYVSTSLLLLNGERPMLLNSSIQDNNILLNVDLTNGDVMENGKVLLHKDSIHIKRSQFIWEGALYQRIRLSNFGEKEIPCTLSLVINGDFLDLFEIRGMERIEREQPTHEGLDNGSCRWFYPGRDKVDRYMTVDCFPQPTSKGKTHYNFEYQLKPGEKHSIYMRASCHDSNQVARNLDKDPSKMFFTGLRARYKRLSSAVSKASTVTTDNEVFNEILCRAMADLYTLNTRTDHGFYPFAGIPWYSTAFGRDGIITALQTLWLDPQIAKGVLRYLAALQAKEYDPKSDAEPGKILHETRDGELAKLGVVPFKLYYGSTDSTVLFVLLAGEYVARTNDTETLDQIWPNVLAALEWMDRDGDEDKDGFIEYSRKTDLGLTNQGWKDSWDSVFHADGSLAEGPIALCEVQAYAYAAKESAAKLAALKGSHSLSHRLREEAEVLKRRFNDAFWCEDLGMYALALDGKKRQCRVRSSNAGQTLFTGIVPEDRAKRMADQFLERDFFTGWGIRTIPLNEKRYNPMSYHNGSVWPHDNALIAMGFARYGLMTHCRRLFNGIFDAAGYFEQRRMPELFCGFRRLPGQGPIMYPVACIPQAWAAVVPFTLLQATLGLAFSGKNEEISFRHPSLPDFLQYVHVRGLKVGQTQTDVIVRRHGQDVSINTVQMQGEGKVGVLL